MTSQLGHRLILAASALALALISPAGAQSTVPESMFAGSAQPAVISNQLRLAVKRGRVALAGLQATSPDDATPIDPSVIQAARETYGLIRAAKAGMELSRAGQKFPDPVLELNIKKVTRAFDLSRIAVDKHSWGIPRRDYLAQSIPTLSQAISLVDQVLVVMP